MSTMINMIAFKLGWLSVVIAAAQQMPWLGTLAVLVAILIHLARALRPMSELLLILACGAIGAVWDTTLLSLGWVAYPSGHWIGGASPYWIIAMWMLFATTLNVSLFWLKSNRLLAMLFGLIGGPLSYYAGAKLGGVILVDQQAALIALGIGWALMMPLMVALADRFDGFTVTADNRSGWILD